jgi:hypothetical protein
MTRFQSKEGGEYTVWWVNLDVATGENSGYGLRVRENNAPTAKPNGEPKLSFPTVNQHADNSPGRRR